MHNSHKPDLNRDFPEHKRLSPKSILNRPLLGHSAHSPNPKQATHHGRFDPRSNRMQAPPPTLSLLTKNPNPAQIDLASRPNPEFYPRGRLLGQWAYKLCSP